MRADVAAITDPGRRRTVNEDHVLALALASGAWLLVVADGVGGMDHGAEASRAVVDALAVQFAGHGGLEDLPGRLEASIEDVNRRMVAEQAGGAVGGTTVVAAVLWNARFAVAHVGDSRAYRFRAGALERLTEDHSLVAEQVRAGILSEAEATTSRHRNVITRSIGTHPSVVVEMREAEPIGAGDALLLCSDGLHGVVDMGQIAHVLAAGDDAEAAATRLVEMANDGGGPDNISVVVARVIEA